VGRVAKQLKVELIAEPSGTLCARKGISEKCGSGVHAPIKAEGFAITSFKVIQPEKRLTVLNYICAWNACEAVGFNRHIALNMMCFFFTGVIMVRVA